MAQKVIAMGDPVDLCIPTGNFGNILAAYYAKVRKKLEMIYDSSREQQVKEPVYLWKFLWFYICFDP